MVIEEAGINKKIIITDRAQNTEGNAGGFTSGEMFTSLDLLKIMLLSSSNDAAVAFEDYLGGPEPFLKLINRKAAAIGMTDTNFFDGSGLSDLNRSNATDLLKLLRYILENHPEIFNWTRQAEILVQPINDTNSRTITNINTFIDNKDFLGGKTGTSEEARENLVAIFTINNYRSAVVILGSVSRVKETESILNWINGAYQF